jgi:PA14 domain
MPALSRCETSIDNDFGTGSPPGVPANGFSARYEGRVNFDAADYEFALTGDDGVRLWIDGDLVIDRWVEQAATTYRATRAMTAGVHNVRVDYYEASGLAVVRLAATKQLAAPPPPLPSLPSPGAPTLQQVNGGPGYYGQFANALPSGSDYFPIGGWVRPAATQAQMDAYRDFGMNLFVGVECPECANESLIRSNGLKAIIQSNERTRFNDIGSETSGWLLHDEIDMCCGPPGFDGGNGYNMLTSTIGSLPQDGRFRYNNYGKGVMFWESDVDAARFVNEFQQVVSNDIYWFTDPNEAGRPEAKRGSSYGLTVDRMQFLDRMDGREQPVWNFVELGWPFTESAAQGGRRILPAELRSAVWHSIIAGARGILYFDHNFGPSTPGSTILNEGYSDTRAAAKAVNEQIKQLAPVLNAPFVTSGRSATGDVKHMVKWSGGKFYVFAGAHTGGGNATFTIPCVGDATAIVEGESRSIPVRGGSFSDSFADKNAIHIYRIDGGSTCGLGA